MKTLKLYWSRFRTAMPEALKKLAWVLTGISVACVAMLAAIHQYDVLEKWTDPLAIVVVFCAGGIAFLQFTTANPVIRDATPQTSAKVLSKAVAEEKSIQ